MSQPTATTVPKASPAEAGTATFQSTLTMTVTDLAKGKLQQFLGDKPLSDVGIKVSVMPGGCSGAQYGLAFAEAPEANEVTLVANGVKVFVDPQHAPLLNGIQIDYVDELMGGGFKIHNPNASHSCGCGKSFSA